MIPHRAPAVSPRTLRAGFTLTEIVLALAVISVAFVGVLGLLPAGMDASRQATNSTVIAAILEDVHNRLQGRPLQTGALTPVFFDDHGVFIDSDPSAANPARLYRADVKIGAWNQANRPASISALRPIVVSLYWPVDPNGNPLGKKNSAGFVAPKSVVSYCATTLTGSDWAAIDTTFVPKIEY